MKKGDKIIFVVLLIIVIITLSVASVYKRSIKGSENIAVIKSDGKIIRTIDLSKVMQSEAITIKLDNAHYNTILVKHNGISVSEATCPDKVCIKTGWIYRPGEMIVCLPNKLIISIQGGKIKENNLIDDGTF